MTLNTIEAMLDQTEKQQETDIIRRIDRFVSSTTTIVIRTLEDYQGILRQRDFAKMIRKEFLEGSDGTDGQDAICEAAHRLHKMTTTFRAKYDKPLTAFIDASTRAALAYEKEAERARVAEENRIREEQEKRERERQEAERKRLEEAQLTEAIRLKDIADKAEAEAARLRAESAEQQRRIAELEAQGKQDLAQKEMESLKQKQELAEDADFTALYNSEAAEAAISAPVPEVMPVYVAPVVLERVVPKVPGTRAKWVINETVDLMALARAVVEGKCAPQAIIPNMKFLGEQARSYQDQFNILNVFPGVTSRNDGRS